MQRLLKLLVLIMASLLVFGCVNEAGVRYSRAPGYHEGPPPHAPAHGYRYKYRNHDLQYDSSLGAYIVLGWRNYYYDNGLYFHYLDGRWLFSARLDSHNWHEARHDQVPSHLYRSHERDKYRRHDKRDEKRVPPGQAKKWEREHDDYRD